MILAIYFVVSIPNIVKTLVHMSIWLVLIMLVVKF